MKLRLTLLLVALPAIIAGLLAAVPADAATNSTYVSTDYVTMSTTSSTGVGGVVSVACHSSSRCTGTVYFDSNRQRSYSIAGHASATLSVTMNATSLYNPLTHGTARGIDGQYKAVSDVPLTIHQTSPQSVTSVHTVQTETRAPGRVYYTVNGSSTGLKDMHIEFYRLLRGGSIELIASRDILNSGRSGFFSAKLGTNNAPGSPYRIRLTAVDDNGQFRAWWWRGTNGNNAGGSRYFRGSSAVKSTKDGFVADASFGTITGSAPNGALVEVLAPPTSFSGGSTVLRELDVPSCADVYGQDTSNGTYTVHFLPYDADTADRRYMVTTKVSGLNAWFGDNAVEPRGSCQAMLSYSFSRSSLIPLTGATYTRSATQAPVTRSMTVKAVYSGFSPTSSDRWIRVREQIPGLSILDTPVIAEGSAGSGYLKSFTLPYGQYTVETGRRTGCSAWYASVYPNNSAYFQGEDRGAEAWKAFTTLYALSGTATTGLRSIAIDHGATYSKQGKRPSGYAGWMYRDHCKAYGKGMINSFTVTPTSYPDGKTLGTDTKGAVVKGHVSRSGGRTNKEMMVRLSSSGGTLVLRTDLTDSSGNFYIAGLASGTYTVSVNSDSWRGIGRSFTGHHTITVTAGHGYNLGTLHFSG